VAKLTPEEATQKKIDAALKAERRRVALALKDVPLPSFGSKKEVNAFLKTVKAAVAA
jgi:hypothetical protein